MASLNLHICRYCPQIFWIMFIHDNLAEASCETFFLSIKYPPNFKMGQSELL